MRINLRKINRLIREAWDKGQDAALRGAGKSSCYSWSDKAAREFFPDILPLAVTLIAKGEARLHWDAEKREVVVVPTTTATDAPSKTEACEVVPNTIVGYNGAFDLDMLQSKDAAYRLCAVYYVDDVEIANLVRFDAIPDLHYRVTVEAKGPP